MMNTYYLLSVLNNRSGDLPIKKKKQILKRNNLRSGHEKPSEK